LAVRGFRGPELRTLGQPVLRAPAFASGVIATLGIGLGAAADIGTIVYGVPLREPPYDKPELLVCVGFHTDGIPASGDLHSPATFLQFALTAQSFTDLDHRTTHRDRPRAFQVSLPWDTWNAAALLLGVIGVSSVPSYTAAERRREFGIRLALGAAPKHVGSMVLGAGLRLVTIGMVTGLVASLSLMRFLRSLLYDVAPTSVAEFAGATLLLVTVTLVATLVPARRAARTQPAVVLHEEQLTSQSVFEPPKLFDRNLDAGWRAALSSSRRILASVSPRPPAGLHADGLDGRRACARAERLPKQRRVLEKVSAVRSHVDSTGQIRQS
jgi:FtsX-like permease family protein